MIEFCFIHYSVRFGSIDSIFGIQYRIWSCYEILLAKPLTRQDKNDGLVKIFAFLQGNQSGSDQNLSNRRMRNVESKCQKLVGQGRHCIATKITHGAPKTRCEYLVLQTKHDQVFFFFRTQSVVMIVVWVLYTGAWGDRPVGEQHVASWVS